jgi:hypothetical protein
MHFTPEKATAQVCWRRRSESMMTRHPIGYVGQSLVVRVIIRSMIGFLVVARACESRIWSGRVVLTHSA